jgi:hypothetical protein
MSIAGFLARFSGLLNGSENESQKLDSSEKDDLASRYLLASLMAKK